MALFLAGCIGVNMLSTAVVTRAAEEAKPVDLYQIFSNKQDQMKNEVGSRVFKWSMHLPDDAVIYKSDRANYFNMNTSSYKSNVSLEVNKNKNNSTLEEIFYAMQNGGGRNYGLYFWFGEKEFVSTIAQDRSGKSYIKIVKMDQFYDYILINEAAERVGTYIENRIYVDNNNIYNLQVQMDGQFYKGHPEMFEKLISSFTLSFDEKNPYIKELSDAVSVIRDYENKSYGWKIAVSPYWKIEGIPNARTQNFRALYTDEELYGVKEKEVNLEEEQFRTPEGITVALVSSATSKDEAEIWGKQEISEIKNNYNPQVYEILEEKAEKLGGLNAYKVSVRYNTLPKKPYIEESLYVIGNGYKYKITANIPEDKYKDAKSKKIYEDMLYSFRLIGNRSQYLGQIVDAKQLINSKELKEVKMKKYSFRAQVPKNWTIIDNSGGNMYEAFYFYKGDYYRPYYQPISNQENIMAYQFNSNIQLSMMVGFNTQDFGEIIKERARILLNNDEVRSSLAKVTVESTKVGDIQIYRFVREYDMGAIEKFVKEDETKSYDYKALVNEYTYVFKVNNDVYTQIITIPLAHMTEQNKKIAEEIWKSTEAAKVNYSQKIMNWKKHNNDEYKEESK